MENKTYRKLDISISQDGCCAAGVQTGDLMNTSYQRYR
jgi:hypothetical protein